MPWNPTDPEYFAHKSIDYSKLKIAAESLPMYKAKYIDRVIPFVRSKYMLRGSLFHCMILEPEKVDKRFCIKPTIDKRTKAGKAEHQQFIEDHIGLDTVDSSEWYLCEAMSEAVRDNPTADLFLSSATSTEKAFKWTMQVSHAKHWRDCGWEDYKDRQCEVKVKWDLISTRRNLQVDFKSTTDPSPEAFKKSISRYSYDGQASLYTKGYTAMTEEEADYYWVAVRSTPPHDVVIYKASPNMLRDGDIWVDENLNALLDAIEDDEWTNDYHREVQIV